jgi:hypothetical protein
MNRLFDIMKEEFAEPIKQNQTDCCIVAGGQHEWVHTDECYVCRQCYQIQTLFVVSIDAPSYSNFICVAYQPLTHFKSRLYQLQGKENKQIPRDIIELCNGCNNYKDVLNVLKTHKKPQYYKHKIKILTELGISVPLLTANEEQQIIDIFKQKFPMKQANNSIPYQFILCKILSLIHREDLYPFIELTKNKSKLKKYETIFSQLKF